MAQQRVQHARSSIAGAVPAAADVKVGEIIVNLADRTLRTKNGANALIRVNQSIPVTDTEVVDPQVGDWYLTTAGQIRAYFDSGAGPNWYDVAAPEDLSNHLLKTGGVMTGQITLPGAGVGAQAITVTEATALAVAAVVPALLKVGGTMTGPIVLPAAAAAGLEAVGYTQMAAAIAAAIPPDLSNVLLKTGGVMSGQITLPGGGAGNQAASINELAASIAAHAAQPDPHTAYTLTTEFDAHIAAADPHPGYVLDAALTAHVGAGGAVHANVTGAVAGFMTAADKTKLDGLTGVAAGSVVAVSSFETGAYATASVIIPYDDTIPQSGEGTQFMNLSHTPLSATNRLRIDVVAFFSTPSSYFIIGALFKDADVGALAVGIMNPSAGNEISAITFSHVMVAGTVSPIDFKFRAGPYIGDNMRFNGHTGARKLGGALASSIIITEIKA
jgi:hypothetical protein